MIQYALLLLTSDEDPPFMNREELEKRMDELARQGRENCGVRLSILVNLHVSGSGIFSTIK